MGAVRIPTMYYSETFKAQIVQKLTRRGGPSATELSLVICPPETRPVRVLDLGWSKPGEGGQHGSTKEGDSSRDHQPSP
jgi:hypothetical protein